MQSAKEKLDAIIAVYGSSLIKRIINKGDFEVDIYDNDLSGPTDQVYSYALLSPSNPKHIPDIHTHEQGASQITILHGSGKFNLEGEIIEYKTGTKIYVPQGVEHGFVAFYEDTLLSTFQDFPITKDFEYKK